MSGADEAGEMISQANLPESLIPACLDVLSRISDGERDLIRVIVDVVTELRDNYDDEDMDVDPRVSCCGVLSRSHAVDGPSLVNRRYTCASTNCPHARGKFERRRQNEGCFD
jgi:hypothetical protein